MLITYDVTQKNLRNDVTALLILGISTTLGISYIITNYLDICDLHGKAKALLIQREWTVLKPTRASIDYVGNLFLFCFKPADPTHWAFPSPLL